LRKRERAVSPGSLAAFWIRLGGSAVARRYHQAVLSPVASVTRPRRISGHCHPTSRLAPRRPLLPIRLILWTRADSRLDRINRGIRERPHRPRYQPDDHRLRTRQCPRLLVLWLELQRPLLELLVGREVYALVGRLPEGRECHAPIEGRETFFPHYGECCVGGVAISRDIERVGEGV
jgi:hypothetical protein